MRSLFGGEDLQETYCSGMQGMLCSGSSLVVLEITRYLTDSTLASVECTLLTNILV